MSLYERINSKSWPELLYIGGVIFVGSSIALNLIAWTFVAITEGKFIGVGYSLIEIGIALMAVAIGYKLLYTDDYEEWDAEVLTDEEAEVGIDELKKSPEFKQSLSDIGSPVKPTSGVTEVMEKTHPDHFSAISTTKAEDI